MEWSWGRWIGTGEDVKVLVRMGRDWKGLVEAREDVSGQEKYAASSEIKHGINHLHGTNYLSTTTAALNHSGYSHQLLCVLKTYNFKVLFRLNRAILRYSDPVNFHRCC